MVLDIGLPGIDGFEVLDQLRSQGSRLPVIVLTARDSVTDTVSALEGGADDYMPKPFRFAELLARIRLRLRQGTDGGPGRDDVLEAGGVRLDVRTRRATVGARELELSAREFALAETLMVERRPGALPRTAPRQGLGLRLRPRLQRRRRLHRLPAQEVRRRHHRHRARHGLPLQPLNGLDPDAAQKAIVPMHTSPEWVARKVTVSVPALLAILRSTLNEPLRPPVVAEPLAATEPLSLIVQFHVWPDWLRVDLALDLEAAVVGLHLELPVGTVRSSCRS